VAINWANINARIDRILNLLKDQHFRIDVAWNIMERLFKGLRRRADLHFGVISAYWAKYIHDHYTLNGYDIDPGAVMIEENYYSYLNLIDLNDANKQAGTTTYIVDYVADSTDLKTGEELDTWLSANDSFQDLVKHIWMTRIAPMYISEGLLVTRKNKSIRIEDYWRHENIIYLVRVWDVELNIMVVFIVGTYDNYPATYGTI
jgi:hypothetical protein